MAQQVVPVSNRVKIGYHWFRSLFCQTVHHTTIFCHKSHNFYGYYYLFLWSGLVRGIDMKKGVLLIVTGVPPNRVASVNTLLRGAITIPDQLFFKQVSFHRLSMSVDWENWQVLSYSSLQTGGCLLSSISDTEKREQTRFPI